MAGVTFNMGGTSMTARSYRIKIIRIPRRELLTWFFKRGAEWPDFVTLPVSLNIPDGSQILQCQFDELHMSLLYVVEHPSYPEVPDGQKPPVEDAQYVGFRIQQNKESVYPDEKHNYPDFPIVDSLYEEVLLLRRVMDDLRQDTLPASDVVDAAYKAGFQKAISQVLKAVPSMVGNFILSSVPSLIERLQTKIGEITVDRLPEEKT